MNKINKIDPSIAFCEKSAEANYNHYFDNKAIIYRKLINNFSYDIKKDCFIAIDTSQQPYPGNLTLFDFGTDSERLGTFNGESDAFGKVVAYSAANDLSEFFTLQTYSPEPVAQEPAAVTITHLTKITSNDLTRFDNALKALLDSGLLKTGLYKDLYQLRSSLDTFESLLCAEQERKTAQGKAMEANA